MIPRQLIIDSGSTKTEWVLLDSSGKTQKFISEGYNPNYCNPGRLMDPLNLYLPDEMKEDVQYVHYYGSGCGTEYNVKYVENMLHFTFPDAQIKVTHDLMAAVHATLGNRPGIACILGTGANACLYDGHDIIEKPLSLGYLVGDEGSGCYIGKKLIRAYFYKLMPPDLSDEFRETFKPDITKFIQRIYHEPEASKYLASFTKFAGSHQDHTFIQNLVRQCFGDFMEVFIQPFPNSHELPVTFVGSVAYHFKDILVPFLQESGFQVDTIMKQPMKGLIKYYKNIDINSFGDNH